jgi:exopolysaccharide biosynthesis protein
MKKINNFFVSSIIAICCLLTFAFIPVYKFNYDSNYVQISSANYNGDKFTTVNMTRSGERIKAKYFAAKDANGRSVYSRYSEWSKNKNIILLCGAAYFDGSPAKPVGITIDNGILVNEQISDRGNGLAIVYATGGIACSNIKEGNLSIKCNSGDKKLNIKDAWDRKEFIKCAQEQSATVFQQHLLVFRNQLNDFTGLNDEKRERRFLAVGKDADGKLVHTIVDYPNQGATLKIGADKVFNFLKDYRDMQDITFMINLDTGAQDVFQLFDKNGSVRYDIKGKVKPEEAVNLLVYYFE